MLEKKLHEKNIPCLFSGYQANNKLGISQSNNNKVNQNKNYINQNGITLIALVVTILFSYDEKLKCSNSKGFLLQTI